MTEHTTTAAAFRATLARDLLIAYKRKNDIVNPFMFFSNGHRFDAFCLFPTPSLQSDNFKELQE